MIDIFINSLSRVGSDCVTHYESHHTARQRRWVDVLRWPWVNQLIEHSVSERVALQRSEMTLTCFRKLVMVFCMSETKSWNSVIDGSVFFLEVRVTFTILCPASFTGLQRKRTLIKTYTFIDEVNPASADWCMGNFLFKASDSESTFQLRDSHIHIVFLNSRCVTCSPARCWPAPPPCSCAQPIGVLWSGKTGRWTDPWFCSLFGSSTTQHTRVHQLRHKQPPMKRGIFIVAPVDYEIWIESLWLSEEKGFYTNKVQSEYSSSITKGACAGKWG